MTSDVTFNELNDLDGELLPERTVLSTAGLIGGGSTGSTGSAGSGGAVGDLLGGATGGEVPVVGDTGGGLGSSLGL